MNDKDNIADMSFASKFNIIVEPDNEFSYNTLSNPNDETPSFSEFSHRRFFAAPPAICRNGDLEDLPDLTSEVINSINDKYAKQITGNKRKLNKHDANRNVAKHIEINQRRYSTNQRQHSISQKHYSINHNQYMYMCYNCNHNPITVINLPCQHMTNCYSCSLTQKMCFVCYGCIMDTKDICY